MLLIKLIRCEGRIAITINLKKILKRITWKLKK